MFYKSSLLGMTGMDINVGGHGRTDAEGVCTRTQLCSTYDIVPLLCVLLHTIKHLLCIQVIKNYVAR